MKALNQPVIRIKILWIVVFLFLFSGVQAKPHHLPPGFDARECDDMLRLNLAFLDTVRTNRFDGFLEGYMMYYRSPSVGLDNASDIWLRQDSTVVIMLEGTTAKRESILADFYCAMVPAKGSIRLNKNKTFDYQLASDPRQQCTQVF